MTNQISYNEKEVIKQIEQIILNRYPIVEDRTMKILDQSPRRKINIDIDMYKDNDVTNICLMDMTNSFSKTTDRITINRLLSEDNIISLFEFIVSDHDYVKGISLQDSHYIETFQQYEASLEFYFGLNFGISKDVGMCLDEIALEINFYDKEDCHNFLYSYLYSIVHTFYDKVKDTNFVREYFDEYCEEIKTNFIESLSKEELYEFIKLLDMTDLIKIVYNIPNEIFIEKYNEFSESNKKELKKIKLPFKNK